MPRFTGLPVGRSHNVVIAEASQHIVAVGAAPRDGPCRAGLIFIDVSDVNNPTQTGCAGQDGYVHESVSRSLCVREREEGGREGEEKQLKGGRVLVRSVSSTTAPTKNTKVGKYATGTMRSVLSK